MPVALSADNDAVSPLPAMHGASYTCLLRVILVAVVTGVGTYLPLGRCSRNDASFLAGHLAYLPHSNASTLAIRINA